MSNLPSTETSEKYPEIASKVKRASLQNDVRQQISILANVAKNGRIDLHDLQAVQEATTDYFNDCMEKSVPPTFMRLCTRFGCSRQNVYAFMQRNPKSPTTDFLQAVQTGIASVVATEALQNNYSAAVAIFLMKNSGVNLTDDVRVEKIDKSEWDDPHRSATDIMDKYRDFDEE